MIPETLYMPNYTQQPQTIDCGTLRESIIESWGVDWKIQAAIMLIAAISFYQMISQSFAIIRLMKTDNEEIRKYTYKAIWYLAGHIIVWILSLWLVFVFNLF